MSDKDVREAVARAIALANGCSPIDWAPYVDHATAAIAAYKAALKDQGLVIVPVVPTAEMREALAVFILDDFDEPILDVAPDAWSAVLSASQPKGE